MRLLWGTANLFSHPRYAAGAATNPDPEVFAYAAAQVSKALDVTHRLGGANYVLWGGREGYDTLLNTDLRREAAQLGRFLHLVVEHKHRIGFTGTILIEPKPMEPTKHQYDHDAAAVHAFLRQHGLEGEVKLNIEANHATLAGHSFEHEIAYAVANDLFGSIDINRGDPQLGWDTDQFPNSVDALVVPALHDPGGRRPDHGRVQLRRQAAPPEHRTRRPVPRARRRDRHAGPRPAARRADHRGRAARRVRPRAIRRLGHGVRSRHPRRRAQSRRPRRPRPDAPDRPAAALGPAGDAGESRQSLAGGLGLSNDMP